MCCKFLLFFIIVQELVIVLYKQLIFFNKKRLFRVINTLFYYEMKAVCISKSK
jgi:hypothetical protein